jgi:H3 lysine-79-specific histone-lysine N-methyltransferase
MQHASHLARLQLEEAKQRFKLWGLKSGEMECVEADFCENNLVPKVLKKADLVLVNNEV